MVFPAPLNGTGQYTHLSLLAACERPVADGEAGMTRLLPSALVIYRIVFGHLNFEQ